MDTLKRNESSHESLTIYIFLFPTEIYMRAEGFGKMMGEEAPEICLPPKQQLHWQYVSDVNILQLWNPFKAFNMTRKA